MTPKKILIVEDDEIWLNMCCQFLQEIGEFDILATRKLSEALALLEKQEFDLIVTDLNMLGAEGEYSGFAVLEQSKGINPQIPVIIITGHGGRELADRVMRAGAYEYLTKDTNFKKFSTKFVLAVHGALGISALKKEKYLQPPIDDYNLIEDRIIGNSAQMQTLLKRIDDAIKNDVNILFVGEKGTGKGLIAQTIHRQSNRREGPYFVIDCSNTSAQILNSELFGRTSKGIDGSKERTLSKFEQANGGTIFLSNMTDLGVRLQRRLIPIICSRTIQLDDEQNFIYFNSRIIASTDHDPNEIVSIPSVVYQLFEALDAFVIYVPPLRERKDRDDILALAALFLQRYRKDRQIRYSDETMQLLQLYDYPGNISELENIVKYSLSNATGGIILPQHLPPEVLKFQTKGRGKRQQGKTLQTNQTSNGRWTIKVDHGDVNISEGNIRTNRTTTGLSTTDFKQLFDVLYDAVETRPNTPVAAKEDLNADLKDIQSAVIQATQKDEKLDESFLSRRFRNIARMAPDVLDVVVATLASPLAGLGVAVKKIAEKAKEETK